MSIPLEISRENFHITTDEVVNAWYMGHIAEEEQPQQSLHVPALKGVAIAVLADHVGVTNQVVTKLNEEESGDSKLEYRLQRQSHEHYNLVSAHRRYDKSSRLVGNLVGYAGLMSAPIISAALELTKNPAPYEILTSPAAIVTALASSVLLPIINRINGHSSVSDEEIRDKFIPRIQKIYEARKKEVESSPVNRAKAYFSVASEWMKSISKRF